MTTSEPARLRAATVADFDALVDLDMASAEHHVSLDPRLYRLPPRDAVAAFLRRRIDEPGREVIVAEVDGRVVGRVDVADLDEPDAGSIIRSSPTVDVGISVLPDWRGRGIGHQLMAAAEGLARRRRAERIVLDMHSANTRAIRFYRDLGYVEFGMLMERRLDVTEDPAAGRNDDE